MGHFVVRRGNTGCCVGFINVVMSVTLRNWLKIDRNELNCPAKTFIPNGNKINGQNLYQIKEFFIKK